MAISGTKGQGWIAIPTQYRKASDILNSTLAAFCSAATQKGKEIERKESFSVNNAKLSFINAMHTSDSEAPKQTGDEQ